MNMWHHISEMQLNCGKLVKQNDLILPGGKIGKRKSPQEISHTDDVPQKMALRGMGFSREGCANMGEVSSKSLLPHPSFISLTNLNKAELVVEMVLEGLERGKQRGSSIGKTLVTLEEVNGLWVFGAFCRSGRSPSLEGTLPALHW